jgi:hypothetical protein
VALLFPGRFKVGNRRRIVDEMVNVFLGGISDSSNSPRMSVTTRTPQTP